jgi:hypothetical protein
VGGARYHQALDVGEDRRQRLGAFRCGAAEARPERAGLEIWQDGPSLDSGEIVRHRVDDLVGGRPETLRVHVALAGLLGAIEVSRRLGIDRRQGRLRYLVCLVSEV